MKTKTNLLLLIVLLVTGCSESFLKIEPPGSLSGNSFFRNSSDAEAAITAAYNPLQSTDLYANTYLKVADGSTDDIIIYNTQGIVFDSWGFSASENLLDAIWQACYAGIFRSNLVLHKAPDIEMDQSLQDRILGEARFLRALYYWHLSTLFGKVPLVKQAYPEDPIKSALPKSSVDEIYSLMINDLKKASGLLPKRSEYDDSNMGRATKGAAEALLGKVYLYAENYTKAEVHLRNVISSGEYELLDDFSNLLIVDNNSESIFEVQFAHFNNQGSDRVWYNLPQGQGGFANLLPTQDIVNEFEDYSGPTAINGKDPRLFYSIFRNGDPYDKASPVYKTAWTPTGYAIKKGLFPVIRFDNSNSPRNLPLIRLADVLLMYAEAANENGKPAVAIDAINKVRNRVGMPLLPTTKYPVSNKQQIFEAIVHERRVELAFEYHRLNDLRRWELAEEQLGPLGYVSPKHRYFPIPEQEINTNPNLEQNPNY